MQTTGRTFDHLNFSFNARSKKPSPQIADDMIHTILRPSRSTVKKLIEIEEDSDDSKPKKADSSKETKSRPIIEHLDNLNESDSELNESSSLSLSLLYF